MTVRHLFEGVGVEIEWMTVAAESFAVRPLAPMLLTDDAGVVRDELLQMKGLSTIEEVFAPKVHGTLVLDELVVREGAPHAKECDFVLLYSSTSTAIAPTGQVDYVAANAFLDAYAEQRASEWAEGPRVTSLHWGIWRDVGMAAEAFERRRPSAAPEISIHTSSPATMRLSGRCHSPSSIPCALWHLLLLPPPQQHSIYDIMFRDKSLHDQICGFEHEGNPFVIQLRAPHVMIIRAPGGQRPPQWKGT